MSSLANSEEIIEGNSSIAVDSSIQQVVGSGGQRVITIVTDGVPLGNIQTAIPTGGIGQPFIVTVQDGQQGELSHVDNCLLKDILDTQHTSKNGALGQVRGKWRMPYPRWGKEALKKKKKPRNQSDYPAAAKLLQSCPTLCDPMDCSLPGFSVHGILQARTLEWVAISFSNA